MTLVKKDKYLKTLEQSLLTLSATSITPDNHSTASASKQRSLPVLDTNHISVISKLLDSGQSSKCRVSVEEEERKRISRELHDGLGQILTGMNMHIQRCLNGCDENPLQHSVDEDHAASLHALSSMVKQAMNEVRSICSSIRPAILDDLGVIAAVTWQCRQIAQISADFNVVSEISIEEKDIPEALKTVIYRIIQESLNNALKYSQADQVKVRLMHTHNTIQLVVEDNGVGFDPAEIKDRLGMGLMSMRERAESVNGFLKIDANVNQGVRISASFPAKRIILNG